MPTKKKRTSKKRDLVKGKKASFFAKRGAKGQFKDMDERGPSLATDRRRTAKRATKSGHGDQGDRRKRRAA